MRFGYRGNRCWWFAGLGVLGGALDTATLVWLGVELTVAGRDLTLWVALYLCASFALICFFVGHYMDARERAREDALTIERQLEQIQSSQRVAAQNEKLAAIGRLAAGIAHEVRNPLGVMRASASMVQEGFEPGDESYRALAFITEESDRLNGLITSLLAFARPAEPRRKALDIHQVVERALSLAAPAIDERGILVKREDALALPSIAIDPDLISQALLDLLTNAAEALEPGGAIALRTRRGSRAIEIEVADDGPGVAEESAGQVFEPFFTTKDGGTGLGLPMVSRIAESHGGHVELVPGHGAGADGAGACFRLTLPLAPAGASARA